VLVELKFATEKDIAQALTCQYGFPYLPLDSYDIDESLTSIVPLEIVLEYCLIPIDRIGNTLTVVMADPTNALAVKDIEYTTGCKVQTFVASASEIQESLNKLYKGGRAVGTEGLSSEENVSKIDFASVAKKQPKKGKNTDDDVKGPEKKSEGGK